VEIGCRVTALEFSGAHSSQPENDDPSPSQKARQRDTQHCLIGEFRPPAGVSTTQDPPIPQHGPMNTHEGSEAYSQKVQALRCPTCGGARREVRTQHGTAPY
jgi:hypothetical protein